MMHGNGLAGGAPALRTIGMSARIWPGKSVSPRRLVRRPRRQLRASSPSTRRGSSSASSTGGGRRRERERIELPERTAHVFHGYVPGLGARAALRLPRPRPLRSGARPALQPAKLLVDPYARAIANGRSTGARRCSRYDRTARRRPRDRRPRRRRGRAEGGRRRRRVRLGATTAPPRTPLARHGHLRGAREGLHRAPPGRPGGAPRHLRRPRAREPSSPTSSALGVTTVELLPVHEKVDDELLVDARA